MKIKHINIYTLLLVFCCFGFSCKHKEHEYHSVHEKFTEEGKHFKGVDVSSENYFDKEKMMEISEGDFTFLIPKRTSEITSYQCTECHTKPLSEMQDVDVKKAHWNIKLHHADATVMNCVSCHNSENMDKLKSATNIAIDLNKSYKLCSQCHHQQFEDWKGGAHGKRIGGWAPPRASMTCVNCHNPHNPSFESKWPERYNTQKVKERN